jgi:hypothetical protein
MDINKDVVALGRISRTSEYRGLSKVEKGLKLMAEQGCSKPLAAKAVNCSVSALF